ncbi:MAG: hypothetical protein MZV70_77575 [Desulfobacterales bacterium]|nr:hypothetical protein [Desulfobacterales bacterium]
MLMLPTGAVAVACTVWFAFVRTGRQPQRSHREVTSNSNVLLNALGRLSANQNESDNLRAPGGTCTPNSVTDLPTAIHSHGASPYPAPVFFVTIPHHRAARVSMDNPFVENFCRQGRQQDASQTNRANQAVTAVILSGERPGSVTPRQRPSGNATVTPGSRGSLHPVCWAFRSFRFFGHLMLERFNQRTHATCTAERMTKRIKRERRVLLRKRADRT